MSPHEHSATAWVDVARGRAEIARVMLWIAVGVRSLNWAWTVLGMALMGGIPDAEPDWTGWWDGIVLLITTLWLLTYFATGIAVVSAQRGFTRCLGWFGLTRPQPGLAWGTWSWFVPFANLIVPYQAFRQLGGVLPEPSRRVVRRAVGRWWFFWLTASIVAAVSTNLSFLAETPRPWLIASTLELVASAAFVAAGLLLAGILGRLRDEYVALASEREEQLAGAAEERLAATAAGFQLAIPLEAARS